MISTAPALSIKVEAVLAGSLFLYKIAGKGGGGGRIVSFL